MKIDIMSDLHINAFFKHTKPDDRLIEKVWKQLEPKGDVLIVAGDIGEINQQNVNVLAALKRLFYKEIVCVFGNHDLHCLHNRVIYLYDDNHELVEQHHWDTFAQKIEDAKDLYRDAGIHLLDGNIVEIDGVKIGGAMGWYDGGYSKFYKMGLGKHRIFRYREYSDLQELWQRYMPDDDIKPMGRFDGLLKGELLKIDAIVEQCDVMITHINPSIEQCHQHPDWKDDPSCGFYCFNGKEYTNRFNGSHWIFGHSHFVAQHTVERENKEAFELITNTLGYPDQNRRSYTKIKTIEI